jgi:hypothetical protein
MPKKFSIGDPVSESTWTLNVSSSAPSTYKVSSEENGLGYDDTISVGVTSVAISACAADTTGARHGYTEVAFRNMLGSAPVSGFAPKKINEVPNDSSG